MKIDMKDLKLGFWIGAGLFVFSSLIAVLTWAANRAVHRDG